MTNPCPFRRPRPGRARQQLPPRLVPGSLARSHQQALPVSLPPGHQLPLSRPRTVPAPSVPIGATIVAHLLLALAPHLPRHPGQPPNPRVCWPLRWPQWRQDKPKPQDAASPLPRRPLRLVRPLRTAPLPEQPASSSECQHGRSAFPCRHLPLPPVRTACGAWRAAGAVRNKPEAAAPTSLRPGPLRPGL